MADIVLRISQPLHGAGLTGPVALSGTASTTAGLFFKWFSPLNALASQAHPEINSADHSATCLGGSVSALGEFGSHSLLLAATDQDGIGIAAIQAVTRSAMAGGAPLPPPAPPSAPAPCVVHQVVGALIRTPASAGLSLSKAATTVELLAPGVWAKPDPATPGAWVAHLDYQAINGLALRLRLAPVAAPTPANSAEIALLLPALPFFRADDKTWLRWTGALPANLGTGAHVLSLITSAGSGATAASVTVSRNIVLVA